MIRQAHTYLVGAVGGATLIALAIVAFAVLVSAQVFRDWPIAALGGNGDEAAAVSGGHEVSGGSSGAGATEPAARGAGEGAGTAATKRKAG